MNAIPGPYRAKESYKNLPAVFGLGADHYIYYYYLRCVQSPQKSLQVIGKHLKKIDTYLS